MRQVGTDGQLRGLQAQAAEAWSGCPCPQGTQNGGHAPLRPLGDLMVGLLVSEGTHSRGHLRVPSPVCHFLPLSEPGALLCGEEMAWDHGAWWSPRACCPPCVASREGSPQIQPWPHSPSHPGRQCGPSPKGLQGSQEEGTVPCSMGSEGLAAHPPGALGKGQGQGHCSPGC